MLNCKKLVLNGRIALTQNALTSKVPHRRTALPTTVTLNGFARVDEFVCVYDLETTSLGVIDGTGDLVIALGGTARFDPATTINGIAISEYDAETNAVRITFEPSELDWASRVLESRVEMTDPLLADDRFVFRFDRYENGSFIEFYATDASVFDASAPAYEATRAWNGLSRRTLVDASAVPGWNYYRIRLDEPLEKGGVLLSAYASPTRFVAAWVGDDEPTRVYYYRGGARGSFIEPCDWVLTPDGLVPCVEKPTQAGATFYVGSSFEAAVEH